MRPSRRTASGAGVVTIADATQSECLSKSSVCAPLHLGEGSLLQERIASSVAGTHSRARITVAPGGVAEKRSAEARALFGPRDQRPSQIGLGELTA